MAPSPSSSRPYLILFALWLLMFSASSQVMIIAPILPQIGAQLDIPEAIQGTLVTSYALMAGLCAVVMGPVSDKIGRRSVLMIGTGSMAFMLFCHALAFDYVSMLLARALAGAAGGVLSGSTTAYVGDYFPYERRGWANGWVMTGIAAGQVAGIPLGTLFAEWYGYDAPFLFFAVPMTLAFILVWMAVPQPPVRRIAERLTVRRAIGNYADMMGRPSVPVAVVSYCLMFISIAFFVIYLPTWLTHTLGVTGADIASLFMTGGLASVFAGPYAGRLSDRIGRKRLVLIACVGASALMAMTTFVLTRFWVAYVLFFLAMVLMAARMGPFQALLSEIVPDEQRGSLMSLSLALGQMCLGVGGALAGIAYTAYGYLSNTMLGAASMLLMGLLVWYRIAEPPSKTGAYKAVAPDAAPQVGRTEKEKAV